MTTLSRITVVGSINVDITATTATLPGPGETVAVGIMTRSPGGKGGNQAAAAARLGANTRMIGAVGDDQEGRLALDALSNAGVDISAVRTVDVAATGTALIVVDSSGENQIAVCPGANGQVRLDDTEFDSDTAVIAQLEIPMPVVDEAARRARGLFVLNAAPYRELSDDLLAHTDLLVVNEVEYTALGAARPRGLIAVTRGADGAVLIDNGVEVARAHGVAADTVSTVGAGDAFCAALTVGLMRGMTHEEALNAACAVGAAAVADTDTQPRFSDLAEYIR